MRRRPSPGATEPPAVQIFRTPAVVASGLVDTVFGTALGVTGVVVAIATRTSTSIPLGASMALLGFIIGGVGASRVTAHLQVHATKLVWTWAFSRHELSLADAVDADLVESGSPQGGGAIGGLVGGGFVGVAFWWLLELAHSMFAAGPTLGSRTLVVVRRHGAPIRVSPIGTFAGRPQGSVAGAAETAVKVAIWSFHTRIEHAATTG